jgi:hypothetical protein
MNRTAKPSEADFDGCYGTKFAVTLTKGNHREVHDSGLNKILLKALSN